MNTGRYYPIEAAYVRSGIYSAMTGRQINEKIGVDRDTLFVKKTEEADYQRKLYLKFDLSGFDFSGSNRLKFFVNIFDNHNDGVLYTATITENDWTPDTLTWDRQPTEKATGIRGVLLGTDFTDAAKKALAAGETILSVRLEPEQITPGELRIENPVLTQKGLGVEYAHATNQKAFSEILSGDKEKDDAVWAYARNIVDEWTNCGRAKTFSHNADRFFELETVDVTVPSKTHTVLCEGKGGNPVAGDGSGFTKYLTKYARTLETLKSEGGFVPGPKSEYDKFGGITNSGLKGKATGFFHTERFDGERTYIIDPVGNPFFACGANTINCGSTPNQKKAILDKFGSEDAYWEFITKRLMEVGVNTVTGSEDRVTSVSHPLTTIIGLKGISAYMRGLGLATSTGGSSWFANNNTMNVFDPEFQTAVDEKNKPILEKYRDNRHILGYTSDNELPKNDNMLERYLLLDPSDPINAYSYATAWTWLSAALGKKDLSFDDLNGNNICALREEFKAFVFGRLFSTVNAVIRKYDPNHMYIGTRADSNNKTSEGYLRAAGTYCEVLTINMYGGLQPSVATMATIYRYSGKPFIVTEFYAKAADAKDMNGQFLGNQENAGWQVHTQEDRGHYYDNYTTLLLECKYCVGWIWYRFQDNDQSLYTNDGGKTILRVFKKGQRYAISSFVDQNNNIIPATGNETQIWKGEIDTSNLGSNKGLFDNFMNEYKPVTDAYKRISLNLFSLIRYFDNLHK